MKKLISVVLSVLLLAACFTACAKPNSGDTATTNKPETQQTAAPADNDHVLNGRLPWVNRMRCISEGESGSRR